MEEQKLSCRRPYSGWKIFSEDIRNLMEVLQGTKLLEKLERFSLKYLDLIELKQPPDLHCLNLDLKLAGHDTRPVQLRSEIHENFLTHIVQIVSPAQVTMPGEPTISGVLLDIDTIYPIK